MDKKPLWRKKSKDIRVSDIHAKYDKNTKKGTRRSMCASKHGRDFTPLYMFLLNCTQKEDIVFFDDAYREARQRLDVVDYDRIWDIISKHKDLDIIPPVCRIGESTYYSTLYVDLDNVLRVAHPEVTNETLYPYCTCCTHTFNGKPFINKTVKYE